MELLRKRLGERDIKSVEVRIRMAAINNTIQRGDPIFLREDCSLFDFGVLLNDIQDLSNQRKYEVMNNVWSPNTDFQFPKSKESGRARRFNPAWLKDFP